MVGLFPIELCFSSPVGIGTSIRDLRRLGLLLLPAAALALTAMLVTGCGAGSDPRPTVETGLRHYFSTFTPEDSVFPTGAGPPRVKDNACKQLHWNVAL